jgi:hypothetical protein
VQKARWFLGCGHSGRGAQEVRHASYDAICQFAEEFAQPRLFVARLGERHEHARVLVPGNEISDRKRRRVERSVCTQRVIDGGELPINGCTPYCGQKIHAGRMIISEMALSQAGPCGDARLRKARIAKFAKGREASFDDLLPPILHENVPGW